MTETTGEAPRGIIFDFGGVISLPPDLDPLYADLKARYGLGRGQIVEGYRRYRGLWDADAITLREMYRRILADGGARAVPDEELDQIGERDMQSWAVPNPATLAWAKELKATGRFKIGILTDMSVAFLPYFEKAASEFRRLADAEVVSGTIGVAKPDPRIYAEMERRIGLPAPSLLFFDNKQENVDGAVAVGWRAELFTTVPDARARLARLLGAGGSAIILS